jgi:mRNA interferase RelE/StbE
VLAAISILQENPFAGKKLQGDYEGAWSLRVWPYRILYTIHQEIVTVTVLRVGHRQGVYK